MRLLDTWCFAKLVHELTEYEWIAIKRSESGEKNSAIDPGVLSEFKDTVKQYREMCDQMELKSSVARIDRPLRRALGAYRSPTWGDLESELRVLWETLQTELPERRFVFIPSAKALELDAISENALDKQGPANPWKIVWKRFPLAKEDTKEAVYCYVVGRSTACVFHLMRVAEFGLRALARRMKVRLPKNKRLEWAQWQEILKEMTDKADLIAKTLRAGPAKDELLEFYRGAVGRFYGFKDEFRNHVMHTRRSYDEHVAASVLSQVRDFLNKLASRIDEKGRKMKPSNWIDELEE